MPDLPLSPEQAGDLARSLFEGMNRRDYGFLEGIVTGDVVAQEDSACAVWTNKGRSVSGNPYSNSGITYFRFRDGKISFISDYFKDTSFAG